MCVRACLVSLFSVLTSLLVQGGRHVLKFPVQSPLSYYNGVFFSKCTKDSGYMDALLINI